MSNPWPSVELHSMSTVVNSVIQPLLRGVTQPFDNGLNLLYNREIWGPRR